MKGLLMPTSPPDVFVFGTFLQVAGQIHNTLGIGARKAFPMSFPFNSGMIWVAVTAWTEGVVITCMVHTHPKHGICRRDSNDDLLGSSLLHGGEDTSELHNISSTSITSFDVGRISSHSWKMEIEMDFALMTSFVFLACAFAVAIGRIILNM